jgi:hypothetical protein
MVILRPIFHLLHRQGDQIWQIFAIRWAVIFFGQFFLIAKAAQLSGCFIAWLYLCNFYFDKNGLGYVLCDIFPNSSGHPVHRHLWRTFHRLLA